MKLWRVALKSVNKWDKKIRNLYVIQETRQDAFEYVNLNKAPSFEISKVYYLGYQLGSYMFKGGKEE